MVSIPHPFDKGYLSYVPKDRVEDWDPNIDVLGSVDGEDANEPEHVKLDSKQVSKFNEWCGVVFSNIQGLPKEEVAVEEQAPLWSHLGSGTARVTLPQQCG